MIAVGTDILKQARIDETAQRYGQKFTDRILTPWERERNNLRMNGNYWR